MTELHRLFARLIAFCNAHGITATTDGKLSNVIEASTQLSVDKGVHCFVYRIAQLSKACIVVSSVVETRKHKLNVHQVQSVCFSRFLSTMCQCMGACVSLSKEPQEPDWVHAKP